MRSSRVRVKDGNGILLHLKLKGAQPVAARYIRFSDHSVKMQKI